MERVIDRVARHERRQAERVADVSLPLGGGEPRLGVRCARPPERVRDWQPGGGSEVSRLVEATAQPAELSVSLVDGPRKSSAQSGSLCRNTGTSMTSRFANRLPPDGGRPFCARDHSASHASFSRRCSSLT